MGRLVNDDVRKCIGITPGRVDENAIQNRDISLDDTIRTARNSRGSGYAIVKS